MRSRRSTGTSASSGLSLPTGGRWKRDFTYIDDIVEGIIRVMGQPPATDPAWSGNRPDPSSSFAPYRIYNIGNNQPVALKDFITIMEGHLGRTAKKNFLPLQAGMCRPPLPTWMNSWPTWVSSPLRPSPRESGGLRPGTRNTISCVETRSFSMPMHPYLEQKEGIHRRSYGIVEKSTHLTSGWRMILMRPLGTLKSICQCH